MLIHRPDFHLGVRMGVLDLSDLFWQLALEHLLLGGVGFVVTGTRHLEREAQPLEILPAALGVDRASGSPTYPTFRPLGRSTSRHQLELAKSDSL
jgi:hypothetical protein